MIRCPRLVLIPILATIALPAAAATSVEQSLRDVDAAWVRAAQSGSVDGWMSFYSDDALVLPPNEAAATSRSAIRRSIAALLSLPGLNIEWHPTRIEASAAGDLAALAGAYTLSYRDAAGATVSDRGKLLEVWRRGPAGDWKCVLDTWNSDLPPAAATPAPALATATAPGATPTGSVAPPSTVEPATATATAPTAAQLQAADYGDAPQHAAEAIHAWFRRVLVSPETVRYLAIGAPEHGYLKSDGLLIRHPTWQFGWTVRATIDAQSGWGAYVGPKIYTFLFRGDKIVGSVAPPAEGERK
jgi:ketosteroid isomerase-like protein